VLREMFNAHELLGQLIKRDLRLRYRQAVMGFAWAILMPALTIGAGLVIRSVMAQGASGEDVPSIGGITIKSWAWAFFAGGMNFGTTSLLGNISLVTKIYFPREVLPAAAIATQGVDSLLSLALILLAGPWLGFHWSVQLLWMPLLILVLAVFTTGLAFLFACANLFFRDVKYILQVLLTFGVLLTPVFVEPAMAPRLTGRLLMLNPLGPILEGMRLTLVSGGSIGHTIYNAHGVPVWTPWHLVYSMIFAAAIFVIGISAFRRTASMFAEYY
jgi:ABC-type polysaccharide/polyol phosphate export permease